MSIKLSVALSLSLAIRIRTYALSITLLLSLSLRAYRVSRSQIDVHGTCRPVASYECVGSCIFAGRTAVDVCLKKNKKKTVGKRKHVFLLDYNGDDRLLVYFFHHFLESDRLV